jgi:hypothetical protein
MLVQICGICRSIISYSNKKIGWFSFIIKINDGKFPLKFLGYAKRSQKDKLHKYDEIRIGKAKNIWNLLDRFDKIRKIL